jgi:perosamine synthetase
MTNKQMLTEINEALTENKLSGFRGDLGLTEGGVKVQRLEDAFRKYFGVKHAIAFNSATSALHAACVAVGIGSDLDNVMVTPFSFTASVACVEHAKGVPVFFDIDPMTYCMAVEQTKPRADAIIPVHLFGGCADMDAINTLGVPIIEDACQAIGSKYKGKLAGTIGDCGVFSFSGNKPISGGEGGMLITDNDDIAYKSKLVRNHGEVLDYKAVIVGYNYRMLEITAIIVYHRFKELDNIIDKRRHNVEYFKSKLEQIDGVKPMWINPDVEYSWFAYGFETEQNNHIVAKKMKDAGVFLRGGYITRPLNIPYNQPCPVCEDIWANKLIVTDVIGKEKSDIDVFVKTLRKVLK